MLAKTIALTAHDDEKADILALATFNQKELTDLNVAHSTPIATDTATADLIIPGESL